MPTSKEANLRVNAATIIASILGGNAISAAAYGAGSVVATIGAHTVVVGNNVTITGATPAGYNGNYIVTAVAGTTITYSGVGALGAYVGGGVATIQVQLGRQEIEPTRDFSLTLVAATSVNGGPAAIVLPAKTTPWEGQKRVFMITVPVVIYFGSLANTHVTFTGYEDVWSAIRDALCLTANWTGFGVPDEIAVEGPETLSNDSPNTDIYKIDIKFWGGAGTA